MIQNITDIIRSGDNNLLKQKLSEDPSLADAKTEAGISILQFAVYCRNIEAADILKRYKNELDVFEAASLGDNNTVSELLAKNPELKSAFSTDGFTLLGLASFFGHISLVMFLLDQGADPNMPSENQIKVAPLHSACAISNYEISELLLKNGADVNARQLNGYTPLHSAAHNGKIELVKLLINKGADINARSDDGKTPLSMALERNFRETADYLVNNGGHS